MIFRGIPRNNEEHIIRKLKYKIKILSSFVQMQTFASFEQALDYYVSFLKGEHEECPTHGPLDHETKCIIEPLIEINRSGFLTLDSQPATYKRRGDKRWRQHEYVYGITNNVSLKMLAQLGPEFEVYSVPLPCVKTATIQTAPPSVEEHKKDGEWISQDDPSEFHLSEIASSDYEMLFGEKEILGLFAVFVFDTLLPSSSKDSRKGLLCKQMAEVLSL